MIMLSMLIGALGECLSIFFCKGSNIDAARQNLALGTSDMEPFSFDHNY